MRSHVIYNISYKHVQLLLSRNEPPSIVFISGLLSDIKQPGVVAIVTGDKRQIPVATVQMYYMTTSGPRRAIPVQQQ